MHHTIMHHTIMHRYIICAWYDLKNMARFQGLSQAPQRIGAAARQAFLDSFLS